MVVVNDVILNVTGTTRRIDAELDDLSGRLRRLDGTGASIQIKTDAMQSRRDLEDLRRQLRSIDRTHASPEVQMRLDRAMLEVDRFEKRLDDLGKKKIAPDRAIKELLNLRTSMQRVGSTAIAVGKDIAATMRTAERDAQKAAAAADKLAEANRRAAEAAKPAQQRTLPGTGARAGEERSLGEVAEAAERAREAVRSFAEYVRREASGEANFTISVDDFAALRELEVMRAKLKEIDLERAEPRVQLSVTKALADLELLETRIHAVGSQEINVKTRKNVIGELEGIERGIYGVARAAVNLTASGGKGMAETFGDWAQHLKSLTPLVNGVAGIIAVKLLPAILATGGGLIGAAAGAGLFATALAALGGPIIGVVIAAVVRLQKVLEAAKLAQDAKDAADRKSAEGSRAAAQAAVQRRNAERSLGDATRNASRAEAAAGQASRNVAEQRAAGYRAMEDAAEAASDAIRGITDAELSADEANLAYREAVADLKDYQGEIGATGRALDDVFKKFTDVSIDFDAGAFRSALTTAGASAGQSEDLELERKVLAVRRARQEEKNATDAVGDSRRDAGRAAEEEADFVKRGLAAYEPYVAAVEAEKGAQDTLRDALRNVTRQRQDLANVIEQGDLGTEAAEKAEQKYDDLSDAEKRVADLIPRMKDALTRAFGPATEAIIDAVADALERLPGVVDQFRDSLGRVGGAIGDAITQLSNALAGGKVTNALQFFTDTAADLLPTVTDMVEDIGSAFGDLAIQAMPMTLDIMDSVAGKLDDLREWASSKASVPYVTDFMQSFESLGGLLGSVLPLLAELGKVAGPAFRDLVEWVRDGVEAFTEWLRTAEGQETVRQFFEDTIPAVKSFVGFLIRIGVFFLRVWQIISPILDGMFSAFNDILDVVNWVLGVLAEAMSNPVFRAIRFAIGTLIGIGTVGRVVRIVGRVIRWLIGWLGRLGGGRAGILSKLGDWLTSPFRAFYNFVLRTLRRLPRRIGGFFEGLPGQITAAVTTAVAAMAGFGRDMLDGFLGGLTTLGQWVWDRIEGLVSGIINWIRDRLGIASPSKVFEEIGRFMLEGLIKGFTSGNAAKVIGDALLDIASKAPTIPLEIAKGVAKGAWGIAKGVAGAATPFAQGGLVSGPTVGLIGEGRHKEAVLPLSQRVMRRLGAAIASQMNFGVGTGAPLSGRLPAASIAAAGGRSIHIDRVVLPPAPGGGVPDARYQAVQFAKELRRRGGGGS